MQIKTNAFLTWVKAQPPEQKFNFQSCDDCASCRYLIAHLPPNTEVSALVTTYAIRGDSNVSWRNFDFPEVLHRTFEKYCDRFYGITYLVSYGDLARDIECTRVEMDNPPEE